MDNNPNPAQSILEPTPESTPTSEPALTPAPTPTPTPEPTSTPTPESVSAPASQPPASQPQPQNKQSGLVIGIVIGLIVTIAIAVPIILLIVMPNSNSDEPTKNDQGAQRDIDKDKDEDTPPATKNSVSGTWNCAKGSSSANDPKNFYVTTKLNEDMTFVYGPYNDLDNNHLSGTYAYEKEDKVATYGYEYYMITFHVDEYILNGVKQDHTKNGNDPTKMEMGITNSRNNDGRQAITIFTSTYSTYYCYDYSDPQNLNLTNFQIQK